MFCFTFKMTWYSVLCVFDVFAWAFQLKKHSSKLIQIKYTFKSQKLKRCSYPTKKHSSVHVTSYTKSFTEDISLCMLVCNQCVHVFSFSFFFFSLSCLSFLFFLSVFILLAPHSCTNGHCLKKFVSFFFK